jgi:PhnB protein
MADPLDVLRGPVVVPARPSAAFAATLRTRLEQELGTTPPSEGAPMQTRPAWVPQRLGTVTPYLCVRDAARAIDFYQEVFGAEIESEPVLMDDNRVGHAELRFGDTVVMIADEWPPEEVRDPRELRGTTVQLMLYVEDADAVFERAVAAGCRVWRRPAEAYGDRTAKVQDPFGHNWFISTHLG